MGIHHSTPTPLHTQHNAHYLGNFTRMASATTNATKEVLTDLSPIIKLYKDSTVERVYSPPVVPLSPADPTTGVATKDTNISPVIQARLHLPKLTEPNINQKLPILVYYHGGGFCVESAFSFFIHRYMNILAAEAKAIIVSVEYRLAPENPLPIAYEDSWIALQWVASHTIDENSIEKDPWLIENGDFGKLYIGGDSAGGNIVHNILVRAGEQALPGDFKIRGGFLSHPYFWGSKPFGKETKEEVEGMAYKIWLLVAYPSAHGGIDNPLINPFVDNAPSLSELGCKKLLVCLAEKDTFTGRGVFYVEKVKKSGWKVEVEMIVVEGEDHCFCWNSNTFNPRKPRSPTIK